MNHNLKKRCNEIKFQNYSTISNMLLKIVIMIFKIQIPNTNTNYPFDKMEENALFLVCILIIEVDTFSLSQFGLFALQHRRTKKLQYFIFFSKVKLLP